MSDLMDDQTDAPTETPCRANPELWFPAPSESGTEAKYICQTCPVIGPCLEAALDFERGQAHNSRYGIWGSTTPRQRARIDKEMR